MSINYSSDVITSLVIIHLQQMEQDMLNLG